MSSSDDDWMPQSKPPALSGGAVGDMDMMAARRQALRMQREAQQRRQRSPSPEAGGGTLGIDRGSRRPPAAGRLGASSSSVPSTDRAKESSLPAALLGMESSENSSLEETPAKRGQSGKIGPRSETASSTRVPPSSLKPAAKGGKRSDAPSSPTSSAKARDPHEDAAKDNEETIEELKRKIEAKKKVLKATREREQMLTERWRAEKAHKQAEIHQLDAKLRTAWATVEDEKSAAETQVRSAQDRHEVEMRQARQRIEQELKAEYEPRVAALQETLKEKREEEEHLKRLLQSKGETTDVVNAAMAAALGSLVERIQKDFAAEQQQHDNEWQEHVRDLVRHEVRTFFAVGAETEAQFERDELKKNFSETLEFWRQAEDEVKHGALKMDESLMADIEATVREDMGRLQREQLSMEEVYVQSREAWGLEHQKLLQVEFDASLRRREAELEEYRKLRHQLHVDRLRDMETAHDERVAAEEHLHESAMQQLREYYGKEEQLHSERQRVALATQQEVARSTETLKSVAAACEGVLASLKGYQTAVDDSRNALDSERQSAAMQQEGTLKALQDLVVKQASSVEDERRALLDALSKLQILQKQVEQQLETEATWLAEQESSYEGSRAAWDREYRQWKALVQRERGAVEERFSAALTALQDSIAQLNAEERDVNAESSAMNRTFGDITARVQRELDALKEKETELRARQQAMDEVVASLESKRQESSAQWQEMQRERAELASEREMLRREEGKLEQTAETLESLRGQMEMARAQTLAAGERGRLLQHQLALNMGLMAGGGPAATAPREASGVTAAPPGTRRTHASSTSKHRLAQKVLSELKRQLQGINKLSELPIDVIGGPPAGMQVSSNVANLLPSFAAEAVDGQQRPSVSVPQTENASASQRRHVDPTSNTQRSNRETTEKQQAIAPSHSSESGTAGYQHDVSPSPQQMLRRVSSEWSGAAGHTFTNLVGFSDIDSQY